MRSIDIKTLVIRGEDGSQIRAYQDNMGEPYRDGVSIWISRDGTDSRSGLFMQAHDLDNFITGLTAIRKTLR